MLGSFCDRCPSCTPEPKASSRPHVSRCQLPSARECHFLLWRRDTQTKDHFVMWVHIGDHVAPRFPTPRKHFRFTRAESWTPSPMLQHMFAVKEQSTAQPSSCLPICCPVLTCAQRQLLDRFSRFTVTRCTSVASPVSRHPSSQAQHCPEMWDLPCQLSKHTLRATDLVSPGSRSLMVCTLTSQCRCAKRSKKQKRAAPQHRDRCEMFAPIHLTEQVCLQAPVVNSQFFSVGRNPEQMATQVNDPTFTHPPVS